MVTGFSICWLFFTLGSLLLLLSSLLLMSTVAATAAEQSVSPLLVSLSARFSPKGCFDLRCGWLKLGGALEREKEPIGETSEYSAMTCNVLACSYTANFPHRERLIAFHKRLRTGRKHEFANNAIKRASKQANSGAASNNCTSDSRRQLR